MVYLLTCEDTTHVFTKSFTTLDKAKKYAVKYQGGFPKWAKWERSGKAWVCDAAAYIWTIKRG